MFVSSYNTYIHTNTTSKTNGHKSGGDSKSFSSKLDHTSQIAASTIKNTPIDYIDNSKVFNNRQKLQQNIESSQELLNVNKFNSESTLKNAKIAYTTNSVMFSLVAKPKPALSSSISNFRVNKTLLPQEKLSAINTYLLNDRYYRITA